MKLLLTLYGGTRNIYEWCANNVLQLNVSKILQLLINFMTQFPAVPKQFSLRRGWIIALGIDEIVEFFHTFGSMTSSKDDTNTRRISD